MAHRKDRFDVKSRELGFKYWPSLVLLCVFAGPAFAATQTLIVQLHHTVRGNLAPEAKESYDIPVTTGQYVHLAITGVGTDIEVSLGGSKTYPVTVAWISPGELGDVSLIGESKGVYRLDLKTPIASANGQYSITVEAVRNALTKDQPSVLAENLLWKGKRFVREQKTESYKSAISVFRRSLALCRSVHDGTLEAEGLMRIGEAQAALSDN